MPALTHNTRLPLSSGASIPILGLGVWQIAPGEDTERAVAWALKAGYRHIDTATLYANEESVGKAIRESGIPREEIFVTTKLWPTDAFMVDEAFERSLKKLGLDYVDLYLVHWPIPLLGERTWKHMEGLYRQRLSHTIGVSNYSRSQLENLLRHASVPPAVNQIECNPFSYEKDLLDFCQANSIVVEAYSPLTRGLHLDDETIAKVAMQYRKSPAQVLLRWALQKGTVVIPKSSKKERIEENAEIFDFELNDEDMRRLDSLSR